MGRGRLLAGLRVRVKLAHGFAQERREPQRFEDLVPRHARVQAVGDLAGQQYADEFARGFGDEVILQRLAPRYRVLQVPDDRRQGGLDFLGAEQYLVMQRAVAFGNVP